MKQKQKREKNKTKCIFFFVNLVKSDKPLAKPSKARQNEEYNDAKKKREESIQENDSQDTRKVQQIVKT